MVRTFEVEEVFPVGVEEYFRIIYSLPDFKKQFHSDRGDQSEWEVRWWDVGS